jgi:hypothetical protein
MSEEHQPFIPDGPEYKDDKADDESSANFQPENRRPRKLFLLRIFCAFEALGLIILTIALVFATRIKLSDLECTRQVSAYC